MALPFVGIDGGLGTLNLGYLQGFSAIVVANLCGKCKLKGARFILSYWEHSMSGFQIRVGLCCAFAALSILFGVARAGDEKDDTARLTKELGSADANRLLTFVQSQIPSEATNKRLKSLIDNLGSPTFRVREDATRRLIDAGPVALPFLRPALNNSDKEVSSRAQRAIDKIQHGDRYDLPIVAIRQLARLNESRAVADILTYLPGVTEESFRPT